MKMLAQAMLIAAVIVASQTPAIARAANSCQDLFVPATLSPEIKDTLRRLGNIEGISSLFSYTEAAKILADKDLPFYGEILSETVKSATAKNETATLGDFKRALRRALKKRLYTQELIDARIKMIDETPHDARKILGDLSLSETRLMYFGRDMRNPDPRSLLGQYLAASGATSRMIKFDESYEDIRSEGPEKLLVSVSADSFPVLQELFLQSPNFMTIIGHAATLFDGLYYPNEGGKGARSPRLPHMHERMPILLMKTTEAQRFARYTALTADPKFKGWHDGLKKPWLNDGFCAVGGYSCCTHWIGNIPIGDKVVSSYTFPANWETPGGDRTPVTQTLKPFTATAEQPELATVWKVPGHEQLADVIGQQKSNLAGDFASPGAVQMVLYARTSSARVPIVFYVVEDHKAPIPAKPDFFSEPIK